MLLQQFIYYPESKNGKEFSTLELAERGLYMCVIFSNLVCLVVCLVARYWQSGSAAAVVQRKKDLLYRQVIARNRPDQEILVPDWLINDN